LLVRLGMMTLTCGKLESGSKSDMSQFQEGMDAVGSVKNLSVSADWLAVCISLCAILTSVTSSNLLLIAVSQFYATTTAATTSIKQPCVH